MHAWYIFMHECMKAGVHVRFCEKKHDLNVYISLHLSRSMISCVYTLIFIPVGGDAQTNFAERLNLFDTTRGFPRAI